VLHNPPLHLLHDLRGATAQAELEQRSARGGAGRSCGPRRGGLARPLRAPCAPPGWCGSGACPAGTG
jgi:hypothetical protein